MKLIGGAFVRTDLTNPIERDELVHPLGKFALVVVRFVHVWVIGTMFLLIVGLYRITAFCQGASVRVVYGVGDCSGFDGGSRPCGGCHAAPNYRYDQNINHV